MSESKDVFNGRVKEAHIQLEEMQEFYKLCQEGKAIAGIDLEEHKALLKDLESDTVEYSNDMVIDMIIEYIKKKSQDARLLEIIENVKVANISDDNIFGKAYPRYFDGSYYIEIGRKIDRKICLLCDLSGAFFMENEKLENIENLTLQELIHVNTYRFLNDEDTNESFNQVQIYMMYCDDMIGNKFSDKYTAYAREVYEIAIAFLVGHEIGHHYYGHTDPEVESTVDAKIKELMADAYGIEFAFDYLVSAYTKEDNRYGIHQFAGIYIPIIASAYFCNDIYNDGKTHPSIIKRIVGITRRLKKLLDAEGFEEVQNCILWLYQNIEFPPNSLKKS